MGMTTIVNPLTHVWLVELNFCLLKYTRLPKFILWHSNECYYQIHWVEMSQIYSAFFLTLYIHHIIYWKSIRAWFYKRRPFKLFFGDTVYWKLLKIFGLLPFYYLKVPYLAGTNFGFGNITAKTQKNLVIKQLFPLLLSSKN